MDKSGTQATAREKKTWREFELLIAAIEKILVPKGAVIRSPDRLVDIDTGHLREVDASIRFKVGSTELLITIECRKRKAPADVTWIEQIASKRQKVGAAKTIAVSARGFSNQAKMTAARNGIELRELREITPEVVVDWTNPEGFTHITREIDVLEIQVKLDDGSIVRVERSENRFVHPMVLGPFPADLLIELTDVKRPYSFWQVPLDGTPGELLIEIDGQEPDLAPYATKGNEPLGFLVDDKHRPVKMVLISLAVKYVTGIVTQSEGEHFSYVAPGKPDDPAATVSRYPVKIGDKPAWIERFRNLDSEETTTRVSMEHPTLRAPQFSSLSPILTAVGEIDTKVLNGLPITIKLKCGKPFNCVLFRAPPELFNAEYDHNHFVYMKEADVLKIRDAERVGSEVQLTADMFHQIPRSMVRYVDLTTAINWIAKHKTPLITLYPPSG